MSRDAFLALGIDLARVIVPGTVVELAGEIVRRIEDPIRVLVSGKAIGQVVRVARSLMAELDEDQH